MATLDEVISQMSEEDYYNDPIQFVIDSDLRVISIPGKGVVAGVVGDKNINRINFQMSRYYNGFDMSKFTTRVNYINARGNFNYYSVIDLTIEDDLIYFTWLVDSDVVEYAGIVMFAVNMFITDSNGKIIQSFNTSNKGLLNVLEGIQVNEYVTPEEQEDILTRLEADLTKYISSGINQIQDEGSKVKKSLPADYVKMTEDVTSLKENKVNLPKDSEGNVLNGTSGQVLQTNGDGTTSWVDQTSGKDDVVGLTDGSVFYNHISDITYEGEPTNEEIEGDTGETIVNLFDKDTMVYSGLLTNNQFNTYPATGGNSQCRYAKIPVEVGKTYSIQTGRELGTGLDLSSGGVGNIQFRNDDENGVYRCVLGSGSEANKIRAIYDANGNSISITDLGIINRQDDNGIGMTFSVPEGCTYIWINVASNNSLNINILDTLMIEEGTACHDYVPYVSSDTTTPDVTTQGNLKGCEISHIFKASLKDTYARKNLARLKAQVEDFTGGSSFDETMISQGYRKFGYMVEPAIDDIPDVYANGDSFSEMTADKNEVQMSFKYISKTKVFGGWMKIKWQGNLSLGFDKKNFTVKLYVDKGLKRKLKVDLKGWGEQNKFVWKANYIDRSHARNIVSARLWSDIVASRPTYNARMMYSPNHGAVDGFPFRLYVNGEYYGLMTWNIPKDGWMAEMTEDNANHCIICAEINNKNGTSSCDFAAEFNSSAWSVEFPDEISNGLKYSFNDIISCVVNDTDEDFKENIDSHLDIYSAIDYYLFFYLNGGVDNLAKNMLLMTYDGVKWYCGAYDMDATWGRNFIGTALSSEIQCPESYENTNSLLFSRIETCFAQELHDRYFELRETILSKEYIMAKFEQFENQISGDILTEDYERNSGMYGVSGSEFLTELSAWLDERFDYCDSEFKGFNNL